MTRSGSALKGVCAFTLVVDDGRGGEASQSFVVTVGAGLVVSGAPQNASLPPLQVAVGGLSTYIPTAACSPGASWRPPLATGMGLDPATGQLLWTPDTLDVGAHDVELSVSTSSAMSSAT